MGTKVAVKTSWGNKNKGSFTISANTLADALKALQKRNEWGKFDGKIDYDFDSADGVVTKVNLKPTYTIQMPDWSGYSDAPDKCKKEWDRMWAKLDEHEDGHRQVHEDTLTDIQDFLKDQEDLSEKQLKSEIAKRLKDMQTNQDKFDTSTGNGSKKGVELNVAEECQ